VKVAEYVANFLAEHVTRVYAVCGAGAMHLNDAICHHPKLEVVAMQHEQAAAFAAEADARVTGGIACVHVTAGPGGTNAITGIASAYVDSIPMLVIAGQVGSNTMSDGAGLRQLGCNELDLVAMLKPVTNAASTVFHAQHIRFALEQALWNATYGRKGPVFLEIPLDVQAAEVDGANLEGFHGQAWMPDRCSPLQAPLPAEVGQCLAQLAEASRPLLYVGNGIRLANARNELMAFLARTGIPVVTSWNASDLFRTADTDVVGRPGIMGDRAGNFAVQNADFILAIGTRLSVPQTGHHPKLFAPDATLAMVDIDEAELRKPTLKVDIPIHADAKAFLEAAVQADYAAPLRLDWMRRCQNWKAKYPVMQPEYRDTKASINSYYFMEVLGRHLADDAIVVTDVGAAFISAMQSLQLKGRQRLFHSGGVSAMGYGLPGAVGACIAGKGRQTVCLAGDGGMMLNLQELQTVVHRQLPLKIFVFVNGGYMTMQHTQRHHFGRESISSMDSGMSLPNYMRIADAFGLETVGMYLRDLFEDDVKTILRRQGPVLTEVHMPVGQILAPRLVSYTENGKFVPAPLEDMWPYLEREEFEGNMGVRRHEFS
jgi:acetolactate synthase-1/2/3 large subunit